MFVGKITMHSTIIDEHFLALHITTPLKTIEHLKIILEEIEEYKIINLDDLEKQKKWREDHQIFLKNIQELDEKLSLTKNNKINLWDFGEFKPESIIIWPIRFIGASFITMLFFPVLVYKKMYSNDDLEKSIKQAKENFNNLHPNYFDFMNDMNDKNDKFIDKIKKDLNNDLKRAVKVIDFKGNEYNYNKYIENIDSLHEFIKDQLILYYEMVNKVLNIHIHDVMNENTIRNYIINYVNDENLHKLIEHSHEIEELRNRLENRYNDKNKTLEEKDWKTTVDIIKTVI